MWIKLRLHDIIFTEQNQTQLKTHNSALITHNS